MRKKKSLGQHFLRSTEVAHDIADAIKLPYDESYKVVEIGPGEGMLTRELLAKPNIDFFAIELDSRLPEILMYRFPAMSGRLYSEDVLKVKFEQIPDLGEGTFSLVGNLPYNISSQILFKVLEYRHQVGQVVAMFQREVAQRIAASPGGRVYGVISVLVQLYYDVELLFEVAPESFKPPPKVWSGVVRMTRHTRHDDTANYAQVRKLVKAAFSQRRKKLRNAVKGLQFADETLLHEKYGDRRAETLSVEEYIELSKTLK